MVCPLICSDLPDLPLPSMSSCEAKPCQTKTQKQEGCRFGHIGGGSCIESYIVEVGLLAPAGESDFQCLTDLSITRKCGMHNRRC